MPAPAKPSGSADGRYFRSDDDRHALQEAVQPAVKFAEPMSRHTTLRIGGLADAWFEPSVISDAQAAVRFCAERQIPVVCVGAGSNLLVRDGGVAGMVIATRALRRIEERGATGLFVEAGVATGKLLHVATEKQLGGVEFLGGVPGSVGGGLIMNAGTTLGEFKDVTTKVTSIRLSDGQLVERDAKDCGFAYRHSNLPDDEMVVAGLLALFPRPRAEIEKDVRELRERRKDREPKKLPNAGSIFKNPDGHFAGKLIEDAHLKGRVVGGAQISPKHANWIVNANRATAADVLELARIARDAVEKKFGVTLAMEVKVIGQEP